MATTSKSLTNTYEYMNESTIDKELKCTICTEPFLKPVSLSCQHTFCCECIEQWLDKNCSCPICRECFHLKEETYSPINTQIVNNQLNRLLVRCNQCQEENIARGNFRDHESKCTKKLVACSAADIQCLWRGPRDEQELHVKTCVFQQVRPIVDHLRIQLDSSLKFQEKLQEKLEKQSNDIEFLFAFINQGNAMSKECTKLHGRCQYALRYPNKNKLQFRCTVCKSVIRRRHVALHACSLNDLIQCICESCYEKQYPIPQEDEEEDDDDDDS
ncbi:unnamed protein product [Adineta ricciae]|uniref:RING-type domain-containing protein n=1 Tax=Adineta ricciae TaxID=249248 RepID=A0A816C1N0_ADIRI|nr:unnamed protein product [Adineta ricciae]